MMQRRVLVVDVRAAILRNVMMRRKACQSRSELQHLSEAVQAQACWRKSTNLLGLAATCTATCAVLRCHMLCRVQVAPYHLQSHTQASALTGALVAQSWGCHCHRTHLAYAGKPLVITIIIVIINKLLLLLLCWKAFDHSHHHHHHLFLLLLCSAKLSRHSMRTHLKFATGLSAPPVGLNGCCRGI